MSLIKYMGDDPHADFEWKKHWMDDKMALWELAYMNAYRDKDPNTKAYKGCELIFRVNDCPENLYNQSKEALDCLEGAFHSALREYKIAKYCTDALIRSSMSMCCDVTPKEKDGKPVLDISFGYLNFNPYCPEKLSDNTVLDGTPKGFMDSGNGLFASPVEFFHVGYFPKCSLDLQDVDVKNFKQSFVKEYQKKAGAFRVALNKDFKLYADQSALPENTSDGSFSLTALNNVCTYTATVIRSQLEKEIEEKKSNVKNIVVEQSKTNENTKKR